MSQSAPVDYLLPPTLIGRADFSRLLREVESVDGELGGQKVRAGDEADAEGFEYHMPKVSLALSDFIEINKIDIMNDQARMTMKEKLRKLKNTAPEVHMTFAVEADIESMQQLVAWFRANAHPQTLLSAGLQPSLVGGVYLRTPNHILDLSMRALFQSKRQTIISKLEELSQTGTVKS